MKMWPFRGGYVYEYIDLKLRQGEGKAATDRNLGAAAGNSDRWYGLCCCIRSDGGSAIPDGGRGCCEGGAMYGQLESGGWTASIDFDPKGPHADRYRNGKGRAKGKN